VLTEIYVIKKIKYLFLTETAITITFGVQMMQLFSENKADFTKLTGTFGRYFQVKDDYCSLSHREVSVVDA